MLPLVLAAICFAGIHLGIAGTTLRDRVVAVLGEAPTVRCSRSSHWSPSRGS
jgi:uncharacterized membrane protein